MTKAKQLDHGFDAGGIQGEEVGISQSLEREQCPDPEEAHFYFTLQGFEELVRQYGMEHIMECVEDDTYMEMFDFFMPPDLDEEYDGPPPCAIP